MNRRDAFWRLEKVLLAQGQQAGLLSTPTSIGNAREVFVRNAGPGLGLPGRVSLDHGEIVDDTRSAGQVDVIVVDSNQPGAMRVGDEAYAAPECAIAGIEVKSSLAGDSLEGAVRKCVAIKKMTRRPHNGFMRLGADDARVPVPPSAPYAFVVAFSGPTWENIGTRIIEHPAWYEHDPMGLGPDAIWVVDRGVLVKNDRHYIADQGMVDWVVHDKVPGSEVFAMFIGEHISRYGALTY